MWKKKFSIALIFIALIGIGVLALKFTKKKSSGETVMEIMPRRGSIQSVISTTGTVLPENRLEVKPPVNGRIEEILVKEGEKVKAGQTIAWMSSTERAALIDAARGKGEESYQYWQEAYKPIPLISPIEGEVIVATTQPGQTVTTSDAVIVLSDHLIVRAQVDETDIGKINQGQEATVALDAYPETKIRGTVKHIYYESQIINNVTIYQVDVVPDVIPEFFRSGMSATIDFKEKAKEGVILLPQEAVQKEGNDNWVLVKQAGAKEPIKRKVKLGISDNKNTEIISGLNEDDAVIVKTKKYSLPQANGGTNPFLPARRRQ
jgi:membrane fusion protein, macrolide-specific efflux system